MKLSYSILISCILIIFSIQYSFSSIIVSSLDQKVSNQKFLIDLNSDGLDDFEINSFRIVSRNFIELNILHSNAEAVGALNGSLPVIKARDKGEPSGSNWMSDTMAFYNDTVFTSLAVDLIYYAHLRIKKGTDYFYGWLSFRVINGGFYIELENLAFQNIPNQPIASGEIDDITGVVENDNFERVLFYPNPSNGIITLVDRLDVKKITSIEVYDINFHKITTIPNRVLQIDLSPLKPGFYYMRIHNEAGIYYELLIIN